MQKPGTVDERVRQIVEEFSDLEDSIERYRYLVALGEGMPRLPDAERTESDRLPGCQYGVWIRIAYDPERDVLRFRADSDAKITRGLAALLIRVLDEQPPAVVADADLGFLDAIGLRGQLSSHRSSGLSAMIHAMRDRARRYQDPHTAGNR